MYLLPYSLRTLGPGVDRINVQTFGSWRVNIQDVLQGSFNVLPVYGRRIKSLGVALFNNVLALFFA